MKIVYAVDKRSYNAIDHAGVRKKVRAQIQLFERNGFKVNLCQYLWHKGFPQIKIPNDTTVLYFRRIEPSIKLIITLVRHKISNSKLKVVMEIPTYPFTGEGDGIVTLARRISRFIGEKCLKFCVDRIILVGQREIINELYGVPVICANNGVDYDSISMKRTVSDREKGIHLICVSGCFFWHGYDRIIEGMGEYYMNTDKPEDVYLHIVGEGECLEQYKSIASKYNLLNGKIYVYGNKTGRELDALYDMCDIALDCLGIHRKGLYYASSLKIREYVAKGLPFVTSADSDLYTEETKEYIKMVEPDDSIISVKEIIDFYHSIYDGQDNRKVCTDIREKFYTYCDWKFVFEPVVEYIKMG